MDFELTEGQGEIVRAHPLADSEHVLGLPRSH